MAALVERLKLCGDRVLLKPVDEIVDRTESGIWIPPSKQEWQRHRRWQVVATGGDVKDEALRPGAEVIVNSRTAGVPVILDDRVYRVIFEDRIVATVHHEQEEA